MVPLLLRPCVDGLCEIVRGFLDFSFFESACVFYRSGGDVGHDEPGVFAVGQAVGGVDANSAFCGGDFSYVTVGVAVGEQCLDE